MINIEIHKISINLNFLFKKRKILIFLPILTEVGIPVGRDLSVWIIVLSPMLEFYPTLIADKSPLNTAPYQI